METTESKRFEVGDVVRCVDSGGGPFLTNGKEYVVISINQAGLVHHLGDSGEPCDHWPERFTLVRCAPASPAQEAPAKWVPRKGDRVRVNYPASIHNGTAGLLEERAPDPEKAHGGEWWVVSGTSSAAWRTDWLELLEPAPMPSGSAGKEVAHATACECARCAKPAKPDPYAQHREKLVAMLQAENCGGQLVPSYEPNLDRLTAVAMARKDKVRAELDQPTAERRARVSRFDPTPWQDWPKGDDRNEP